MCLPRVPPVRVPLPPKPSHWSGISDHPPVQQLDEPILWEELCVPRERLASGNGPATGPLIGGCFVTVLFHNRPAMLH